MNGKSRQSKKTYTGPPFDGTIYSVCYPKKKNMNGKSKLGKKTTNSYATHAYTTAIRQRFNFK